MREVRQDVADADVRWDASAGNLQQTCAKISVSLAILVQTQTHWEVLDGAEVDGTVDELQSNTTSLSIMQTRSCITKND